MRLSMARSAVLLRNVVSLKGPLPATNRKWSVTRSPPDWVSSPYRGCRTTADTGAVGRVYRRAHVFCTGGVITDVKIVPEREWIETTWSDGGTTQYPFLWMRDNCTCPSCYNEASQSRTLMMKDFDVNVTPSSVQVDGKREVVLVTWTGGHISTFPFDWFEGRSFTERARRLRRQWLQRKPRTWGSEMQDNLQRFQFQQLIEDDCHLYEWINTLEESGVALVRNAPSREGVLYQIGQRVAFLRKTNYGETFHVKAKSDPANVAYLSGPVGFHTDLAYYNYTPGMQMLHCISQVPTKGGENQLSDGFHCAAVLRERHPDMFKLLTSTLVDNIDLGKDAYKFFKLARHPIIGLDEEGNVNKITISNHGRDSFQQIPLELVTPLYRAMKTFTKIMYDPANVIHYKMAAGDIMCFHNSRIVHGRNGHQVLEGGERHLEGGYIDWDEMASRRRVLMMELDIIDPK